MKTNRNSHQIDSWSSTLPPPVVAAFASNTNPMVAPVYQIAPSLRDEASKVDSKQTAVQPRVSRPHTGI